MSILPASLPTDGADLFTGVACPDCSGVVVLRAHRELISFVCRIGHVYSVAELLAAKEELLERRLWVTYSALDELAVLLGDLARQDLADGDSEPYRRRAALARDQAEKLHSLIETERPLMPRGAEDRSPRRTA